MPFLKKQTKQTKNKIAMSGMGKIFLTNASHLSLENQNILKRNVFMYSTLEPTSKLRFFCLLVYK